MKVLAYGDIMDGGKSVFTSVTQLDKAKLIVSFTGVIRIDNPYKQLEGYLNDLSQMLPKEYVDEVLIDFTELKFCNSNGFYVIMDITESIYNNTKGRVSVKRLKQDDWQQETLPVLLNIDEEEISKRTAFVDTEEL
jgi:hypothetical protein